MKYHFISNLITGHNISFPEPAVNVMQFLSKDEYAVLRNINIYWLDHLRNYCQSKIKSTGFEGYTHLVLHKGIN